MTRTNKVPVMKKFRRCFYLSILLLSTRSLHGIYEEIRDCSWSDERRLEKDRVEFIDLCETRGINTLAAALYFATDHGEVGRIRELLSQGAPMEPAWQPEE